MFRNSMVDANFFINAKSANLTELCGNKLICMCIISVETCHKKV